MKIAIVGAAYTGLAAARHFRRLGHQVSVSTTRPERAAELEAVASEVVVTKGSDVAGMRRLIDGADAVVLTMAGGLGIKDGKPYMDPVAYRDSYVGTADGLIGALDAAPALREIVFCSSLNAYGDAHGVSPVIETTPANAASPAAQVFIETEQKLAGLGTERLRVCNFRTGTIYGPGREHRNELRAIAGKQIPFDGESDAMLVHRDDVVRAIDFAIDKRLSGLFNLFNDIPENKRDFFARVAAREGMEPVTWLGVVKGPRGVSNARIKGAGFSFIDPVGAREGEDLLAR
ncbi:MAG: NAD-dependent epimerase/dehydratase family protein [Gammaproteobacteria bacterium]|nr:NAD-dependent epimerase/dehydratase family protein [Gammaproteobacteria bacterium]